MNSDKLQTIGTIAALIISVIALMTTIYEANLMRKQQNAMVWPYLKVGPSWGGDGFSFRVYNNGTGPAIIKSVEVTFNGKTVKRFEEILDKIKPDHSLGYDRLKFSAFNNTVFRSGEQRVIFNMPWDDETRLMSESMHLVEFKVDYESVLGEHWLYDSEADEHGRKRFRAKVEFEQ